MAVYYVADVTVHDPQSYAEFTKQVGPLVAHYGGRFLARGSTVEMVEGGWQPQRMVIVEFPDADHFRAWYESPEYTQARAIRFGASTARAVLAQGAEER